MEQPDRWVQGACLLCSTGCALDIGVKDGRMLGVRGREGDRVNRGRLGPKGLYGWQANHSPDRLTEPLIRRGGKLEQASWNEAMTRIVDRSKRIREAHTSSAIGFYTSGQLFLEEYYTLGVLGKAGLGTPHMDGNTRLCTATSAAALKASFGTDGQPGSYSDLDVTEAIVHFGHNIASEARSDLDIFLDYSRRMEFRDRDGRPLIKWQSAEEAFKAWKACSKGRPCDYSGLTYDKLNEDSGIQWPCADEFP